MILIDFSQVFIGNVFHATRNGEELNDALVRHMVLNNIRHYKNQFAEEYGQVVICCDGRHVWRKDVFPYYKAPRKKIKIQSDIDWNVLYSSLNKIRDEIRDNFQYPVIHLDRIEADDIIAVLCTNHFNKHRGLNDISRFMIVSSDKDFVQLQQLKFVDQFSPITKKKVIHEDPKYYLHEHILRGDSGDGIPNVFSQDEVFMEEGLRQKPLSRKKIKEWYDSKLKPMDYCNKEMHRNYLRNTQLIDLIAGMPEWVKEEVTKEYEKELHKDRGKIFNYFVTNRLNKLMEVIDEF